MEKCLLWITVLVPTMLTIHGETSNVTYEVFNNRTTWRDAANACSQLNGTLIDSSEYIENANDITLSENNTYWTSSFSFMTKWVELKGCFNIRIRNSIAVCKQHDENSLDIGWSCYAYCEQYTYFGIRNGECMCFSETPTNINTPSSNNCPSCSSNSSFQCGVRGYTALYEIRNGSDESLNGIKKCMSYNCQPDEGNTYSFGFKVQSCQGSLPVQCNKGNVISQSISWMEARQVCEEGNSFILRHSVKLCRQNMTAPFWDNIHRDILSLTTGFELRSGTRLHNRKLLKCSSITFGDDKPEYDRCNSSKDGYICKIEHSSEPYTTAICPINQTEPPTHTTTGESISRDVNSSNSEQTTISHTGKTIGNITEADNMVLYIAIAAGVGGFIVIVLIVIIICTCRKRKRAAEKESKDRNEIDLDEGQVNHMEAAERYVSIKSERSTLKYEDLGKNEVGSYEQIVLPDEELDERFPKKNGIIGNSNKSQHCKAVAAETLNVLEDTKTEDDYAELDNESDLKEKTPKIRIQRETTTVKSGDQYQEEDDYDHFGQANMRSSVSSNYDHVHLRNSTHVDDTEDYDHIPGAAGRRNEAEVDSTYDHAQFELRNRTTSNYDHVVLMADQKHSDANRISDDYDHTTNVSKVEIEDENRGSNYTQVTLPDPT